MNGKIIRFIQNFSYTLSSNVISLIISSLIILIVPRLIGMEEYGYWQIYLFYSTYIGFLHIGWNDGIYLRYGGRKYEELNKQLFFSQFYMLLIMQIFLAILVYVLSNLLSYDNNRVFIFKMLGVALLLSNMQNMLLFILQATNRIKEYALVTMMGKILYFIMMISFIFLEVRNYKLMIISDIIGRGFSLSLAVVYCKDIVFNRLSQFYLSFHETFTNISVGIKLMFANIASSLIVGVIRLGVERGWNVQTFGKVSLTLSISKMMMLFINSVGIVMYPILRRTEKKRLSKIYPVMRDFLMVLLLGFLLVYHPLKSFLSFWLPQYSDSITYMALVFPMFIYEGKMALLINTYLKTLRKEKIMLKINMFSVAISILLTLVTTIVLKSINLAILSIVIILAFRAILAEIILSNILKINMLKDILLELSLTIAFIFSAWYFLSWVSMIIFGFGYIIYLIIKRHDIQEAIGVIKKLIKTE